MPIESPPRNKVTREQLAEQVAAAHVRLERGKAERSALETEVERLESLARQKARTARVEVEQLRASYEGRMAAVWLPAVKKKWEEEEGRPWGTPGPDREWIEARFAVLRERAQRLTVTREEIGRLNETQQATGAEIQRKREELLELQKRSEQLEGEIVRQSTSGRYAALESLPIPSNDARFGPTIAETLRRLEATFGKWRASAEIETVMAETPGDVQ